GRVAPRDAIEHRGLARAVRTDDREQLALTYVETDVAQRLHAAELQRDGLRLENRCCFALQVSASGGRRRGLHQHAPGYRHRAAPRSLKPVAQYSCRPSDKLRENRGGPAVERFRRPARAVAMDAPACRSAT